MTKLIIHQILEDTGSRQSGERLRNLILSNLEKTSQVELDFINTNITPSFIDEAIGLLHKHFSLEEFKKKVKISSVTPQHKALIFRVIANRFKKTSSPS